MHKLRIEVVYAVAAAQQRVVVELPAGATAGEAAVASGLPIRHGLNEGNWGLGIGGREVPANHPVRDGDRLEVLRPLALDPKEARRQRARKSRGRRS